VTVPITYRERHFPLLDERVVESGIRGAPASFGLARGKTTKVGRRYLGDYFHCGAVTYREMGYEELLDQLTKAGFEVVAYDIDCPQRGIFRVDLPVKKPVIVATNSSRPRTAHRHQGPRPRLSLQFCRIECGNDRLLAR